MVEEFAGKERMEVTMCGCLYQAVNMGWSGLGWDGMDDHENDMNGVYGSFVRGIQSKDWWIGRLS